MSTPPRKIIRSGDSIVLRGEGMPLYKQADQKGNLYVIFDIEMPDEAWLKSIDVEVTEGPLNIELLMYPPVQTLRSVLPPKKNDVEPRPAVVEEAEFEESDLVDVRARSFPASANFFDQGFPSQFGSKEEDWDDEDEDEDGNDFDEDVMGQPECNPQ